MEILFAIVTIAFMLFLYFHKANISLTINHNHNHNIPTVPEPKVTDEYDEDETVDLISAFNETNKEILGGDK